MKITNLHTNSSPKDCYYILDSNVWLPILGLYDESFSEHYQIFFTKIFKLDKARILLCPLQISEIINRLLRFHSHKIYDQKYKGKTGQLPTFTDFYKQEYRGSEDFKLKYEAIIDDISGYSNRLLIQDITTRDFDNLTRFDARKLDFNDHYLYLIAKEYDAIMITHDSDFLGLDIEVGTFNRRMYQGYKDSIKPKS